MTRRETTENRVLTKVSPCGIIHEHQGCTPYRGVEQLVARRAHNPEVVGSSPASATIRKALLSSGSKASFCPKRHSEVFVFNGI